MIRHHRIIELEAMLKKDGVPMDKLKDAFVLVNREVLKQPELVEIMGASDIGLVTKAAQRLLDIKLADMAKPKKKTAPKSAKAKIAAMMKEAKEDIGDDDWG